jgi:hypothetical protein
MASETTKRIERHALKCAKGVAGLTPPEAMAAAVLMHAYLIMDTLPPEKWDGAADALPVMLKKYFSDPKH